MGGGTDGPTDDLADEHNCVIALKKVKSRKKKKNKRGKEIRSPSLPPSYYFTVQRPRDRVP